jgi:hypothetical protein
MAAPLTAAAMNFLMFPAVSFTPLVRAGTRPVGSRTVRFKLRVAR